MKRDDDLLREMLIEFEAQQDWFILMPQTLGMSEEDRIKYGHLNFLCDAGMVASVGKGTFRLTHAGHDDLEAVRDIGVWENTKNAVAETGGSATLEILKQLATGLVKKKLSEHTGIAL